MTTHFKTLFILFGLLLLSACAELNFLVEKPKIDITGFNVDRSNNKLGFLTELSISNPNSIPLEIEGIFYEIEILGSNIANGTNNKPISVQGFSQEETSLYTSINLLQTLSLLSKLAKADTNKLEATIKAKISIKGVPIPVRLSKSFSVDKP